MTTGEDRNKKRFKDWKLCGLWKLPFHHHGAIKLRQNCPCFTHTCVNLFVPTSVTRKYHPKVLERLLLLQCISAHLQNILPWTSWEIQYLNLFSADFRSCLVVHRIKPIRYVLKTLLRRSTHAVPIRPQKQTVHSAVPKSDIVVDASVTVYQIHINQGSPNVLGEDHIRYCTTARGLNILGNVLFSGYVTFYQINTFFANISFFHYRKNVFCGRVIWLRRSDLARGP